MFVRLLEPYYLLGDWFLALSRIQQLLVIFAALVVLFTILAIIRGIYRAFFLLRRWLRRKLIPRNIDLHLDRDIASENDKQDSIGSE